MSRNPDGESAPRGAVSSGLPTSAELYEQEYRYWPWGDLLLRVRDHIVREAPQGGCVVDYMCGTGYLLGLIREARPDLDLRGVDISRDYVQHGQQRYPGVLLDEADVLDYIPGRPVNVAICTAGVHHLPPPSQARLVEMFRRQLAPDGILIVGEELLPEFEGTGSRAGAIGLLWSGIIAWTAQRLAPVSILVQAARVMIADLQGEEWKLTRGELLGLMRARFELRAEIRVWPGESLPYGDLVFFLCPVG